MKAELKAGPPAIEPDQDLRDQAALCASMLRTLVARWRSRVEAGQFGNHSHDASVEFMSALERAAVLLQTQAREPAGPVAIDGISSIGLAASEERFRLLVESVRDYAICMMDSGGRIASWNAGAERIKGYAAVEVLGKHFRLFYTPEAAAEGQPERELEIAAREGRCEEEGWRVRADGSRFWASVVLTAVRDRAGQLVGFAKVTRDVTERRNAEEALLRAKLELEGRVEERTHELREVNEKLQAAYREAQHAVRMREQILAVVSHDLRNSLAAIHMATAVVLMKGTEDHQFRKHAETIYRSTTRMEHLLCDLLDMASLQSGRLTIVQRAEDSTQLLVEVFELHEPLAREKGMKVVRAVQLEGARLSCDRDRVLQVFGNLIGNAIKLCEAGCVITVRGELGGGEAQFAVADTGPGIPESDQPHLFEPFWSAERHAKKGTGLGLYISKRIVEAHSGRLWVESREGEGATFFFTLPLAGTADES